MIAFSTRPFAPAVALAFSLLAMLAPQVGGTEPVPEPDPLRWLHPDRRPEHVALERFLLDEPSAEQLRTYHDLISREPHVAGSVGDRRVIELLAAMMESLGLEVERQKLWLYLPHPVRGSVEILSPEEARRALPVQEEVLEEDPYSSNPDLLFGWNAYSGSGRAEGEVVYANYGTREDFERLAELGVDVAGKIVVARYGQNFRGYKAKLAQQAGAAGLLMYLDPEGNGYVRGRMWPVGGYANPSSIQRGSILTLPYSGDPLTPFVPATRDAERLDPKTLALPEIPVQPIGWAAAQEILARMDGPPVPEDWQGALPFNYRLTGGEALRVAVEVEQERRLTETENVVGVLRGARFPDQKVIVGCHHDAWSFGAGDPNAGTIVVLEAARVLARAAREGWRPDRTLVFAHWAAEEQGILGSVEWVEAHRDDLANNAVAYLNLDMAAMGPDLRGSSSPSLETLIAEATRGVPKAREPGTTVYDDWTRRSGRRGATELPAMGSLGGGSDHVGFYTHVGIPSAGISAGGSPGVSYHTNYEDLAWYRQVVGEDYEPAVMVTRVVAVALSRLTRADLLPLDPELYGPETVRHLRGLGERAQELGVEADLSALETRAETFGARAAAARDAALAALASGRLSPDGLAEANRILLGLERLWIHPPGLPERPWFRSLYGAPDATSGYSAWMLPALRHSIETRDTAAIQSWIPVYEDVLGRLETEMDRLQALAGPPPDPTADDAGEGAS